jgi:hypothetical protein
MADCHNIFLEFDQKIKLPEKKKEGLRVSRDSLRKKVREVFSEKGYIVKFSWQGSFAMNTIISPEDGDYDIDDGIYMQIDTDPEETIYTIHNWLVKAAEGHTSIDPINKNPCVRVLFSDGHHVDLVLYRMGENDDHPWFGHKKDSWIPSDPKEFVDWFNDKCAEKGQLKRIVRYMKAWSDHLKGDMPSGLILTILACNNIELNARDDVALLETLKNIEQSLEEAFICYRPTTDSTEDLFSDYSVTRKEYFLQRLHSLIESGNQAIEEINQKDACPKWRKHLGNRFPCDLAEDRIDNAKKFRDAAFIKSDARSA